MGEGTLNILHLETEKSWRGGQQQVVYLMDHLARRGYRTALVCQPNSELGFRCAEKRWPVYRIPMRGELDLLAGLRVSSLCRREPFHILHSHSGHALTIGLWSKLFYPKLVHVATRRVDFHTSRHYLSRTKYRSSLLDGIVCVSEQIRTVLIEDGLAPDRLVTIHSGVDLDKFNDNHPDRSFLESYGIPPQHLVIGTVAAMVGHKDYPTLLRAAQRVVARRPHVSFCAIGDGPDREALIRLKKELGLDRRFVFIGFRREIGDILKSFDIFVLASKWEGLGTSLLEAQSAGVPVVATRAGGISDIIEHNVNGILVPPQQPEQLAEALVMLADDGDRRGRLARAGRDSVRRFSIENTVERNISHYHDLVARRYTDRARAQGG